MSSRKSSRKASARKSSRKSVDHNDDTGANTKPEPDNVVALKSNMHKGSSIVTVIFAIIIQGSILYYLHNLESADCNCIKDWRHNYIKYFAILLICFYIISLVMPSAVKLLWVIAILGLINAYAFFTYIGDLNSTMCTCAVDKQPTLNSIMQFYRWLYIITIFSSIILFIIMFVILGGMYHSSKK